MTGKLKGRLAAVLLLLVLLAGVRYLASGSDPSAEAGGIYAFDSFAMGTLLSIKVQAPDKDAALRAVESARAEVQRLTAIFDTKDPTSEISRLSDSRGSGQDVPLGEDLAVVLGAALHARDVSGGVFDPALGRIVNLWGFSEEKRRNHPPAAAAILALLDSTDLSRDIVLSADGRSARLGPRAGRLEMGGIAKGYAVDKAVQALKRAGVNNGLVNLGGEIGVLGVGSNGTCWRVGVQHPRKRDNHLGAVQLNEGLAVATSGDYERFFVDKGRRYCHILDPTNGYPASQGVVSVTVVNSTCMEADAMATAAFILGPDKGIELLERDKCEGLIVYAEGGRTEGGKLLYRATSGFSRYLPQIDIEGLPLP